MSAGINPLAVGRLRKSQIKLELTLLQETKTMATEFNELESIVPIQRGLKAEWLYDDLPAFFNSIEDAQNFVNNLKIEQADINSQVRMAKEKMEFGIMSDTEWIEKALGAARVKHLQSEIIIAAIRSHQASQRKQESLLCMSQIRKLSNRVEKLEQSLLTKANNSEEKSQKQSLSESLHYLTNAVKHVEKEIAKEKEVRIKNISRNEHYFKFVFRSLWAICTALPKPKHTTPEISRVLKELDFVPTAIKKNIDWGDREDS